MKYDCSKTLDWTHEVDRVCGKHFNKGCVDCPLQNYGVSDCRSATQEKIDALQQWSDAHPEQTMQEKFFEMFPNAPKASDSTPDMCPHRLGWNKKPSYCSPRCCVQCWSRPYMEAHP